MLGSYRRLFIVYRTRALNRPNVEVWSKSFDNITYAVFIQELTVTTLPSVIILYYYNTSYYYYYHYIYHQNRGAAEKFRPAITQALILL